MITPSDSILEVSEPYSPIKKFCFENVKLLEVIWNLLEIP
jgi:hypothetical protein